MMQNLRNMQYTLAELIKGLDVIVKGDVQCLIKGICTLQNSQEGCIAFLMNPLYKKYLPTTKAAAVILSADAAELCPVNALISSDPYYIYSQIAAYFDDKPKREA